MMWNKYMWGSEGFGFPSPLWGFLFPLMILDLVLKGISLWRSARNKQNIWFIALLLVNSLGILPAIYLLTHKEKKARK
jgi:methionyl-tRNA synthetase